MSLSTLIRKRHSGEVATATLATVATHQAENKRTVATVATVAVANPEKQKTAPPAAAVRDDDPFWNWRISLPGRELTVAFSPEATSADILAWYPELTTAEPVTTPDLHPPSMTGDEEAKIRGWLSRIGEDDPVTIAEVIEGCRRDAAVRNYFIGRAAHHFQPQ
jgi:hypothetical protein